MPRRPMEWRAVTTETEEGLPALVSQQHYPALSNSARHRTRKGAHEAHEAHGAHFILDDNQRELKGLSLLRIGCLWNVSESEPGEPDFPPRARLQVERAAWRAASISSGYCRDGSTPNLCRHKGQGALSSYRLALPLATLDHAARDRGGKGRSLQMACPPEPRFCLTPETHCISYIEKFWGASNHFIGWEVSNQIDDMRKV
jgi:hypothetical protein